MNLYEGIKSIAKVIQKTDNLELYSQLLDLSSQALDLQDENARLREELRELRKQKDVTDRIIRHKEPFITLLGEPDQKYCAICWGKSKQLIQMLSYVSYGRPELMCQNCHNNCRDKE